MSVSTLQPPLGHEASGESCVLPPGRIQGWSCFTAQEKLDAEEGAWAGDTRATVARSIVTTSYCHGNRQTDAVSSQSSSVRKTFFLGEASPFPLDAYMPCNLHSHQQFRCTFGLRDDIANPWVGAASLDGYIPSHQIILPCVP